MKEILQRVLDHHPGSADGFVKAYMTCKEWTELLDNSKDLRFSVHVRHGANLAGKAFATEMSSLQSRGHITSLTLPPGSVISIKDVHTAKAPSRKPRSSAASLASSSSPWTSELRHLSASTGRFNVSNHAFPKLTSLNLHLLNGSSFTGYHGPWMENLPNIRDVNIVLHGAPGRRSVPLDFLARLVSLRSLRLRRVNIEALPDLGDLQQLEVLELCHVRLITHIPSSISRLESLTSLKVRGCHELVELPQAICQLPQLLRLCVDRRIPGLGRLQSSLQVVSITSNHQLGSNSMLPDLQDCTSLRVFHLNVPYWTTIPELDGLSSLTSLRLELGTLQQLPDVFGGLLELRRVVVTCNRLDAIPSSLREGSSSSLMELSVICRSHVAADRPLLSATAFTSSAPLEQLTLFGRADFPVSIGKKLRVLRLTGRCDNLQLPVSPGNGLLLEELGLWCEEGCHEPGSPGAAHGSFQTLLRAFPRLAKLSLWCQKGGEDGCFPASLRCLKTLRHLEIAPRDALHNAREGGASLPLGLLEGLTWLETLMLHLSSASELPPHLGDLRGLRSLTIQGSATTTLPDALSSLTGLTSLMLKDMSQLAAFPQMLSALSNLANLEVTGCPLLSSPGNGLNSLTTLSSLTLSCNLLLPLSPSLSAIHALTSFTVSRMQKYGCSHSGATELPSNLCQLPLLKHIALVPTCISEVPPSIADLPTLSSLALPGYLGKLMCVPAPCALGRLPLQQWERLGEIHRDLSKVTSLTTSKLPASMHCMQGLLSLHITDFAGASIDTKLGMLSRLTSLVFLRCSALEALPADVGSLPNLLKLEIQECPRLRSVPDLKEHFPKLKEVTLVNCPHLQGADTPFTTRPKTTVETHLLLPPQE